jgi:hypothetical protein
MQHLGTEKMKIYDEKPWHISKGQKSMEDVVQAQGFIRDIGGPGKVGAMIGNACDYLTKLFPHQGEPRKQWTERRLWEWWCNRSDVVRHWQMVELYRAAEIKKQERQLLEAARREHAEFIEKTTRLRSLLERQDEDFYRPQIEGLGGVMGRVDRPRAKGE